MFFVFGMFAIVETVSLIGLIFSISKMSEWSSLTEKQQIAVGELFLTSIVGLMVFTGMLFL